MKKTGIGWVFTFLASCSVAEIDYGFQIKGDEPILYVEKYGRGDAVVVSNGFLFVDFKYVPAPYTIQRVGQAVVVNGIIVNCLYKGEIHENYERRVIHKFTDSKGIEYERLSDPHPSSNLKETADIWVGVLAYWLGSDPRAVFLSKARFIALRSKQAQKPMSDAALEKNLPKILTVFNYAFLPLLKPSLDAQSDTQAVELLKANHAYKELTDEDFFILSASIRNSPELKERIRAETSTPQQVNP